jgi:PAS domain S-box-containing protein/putative nucleotidyltransferase with HDIG domain
METNRKAKTNDQRGKSNAQKISALKPNAMIRESEQRLIDMMSAMRLIALMLDTKGRVIFCNDYLLEVTGWKREEIMNSDWFENFVPGLPANYNGLFENRIKANRFAANLKSFVLAKNGTQRLVNWNNTPLRDADGGIVGLASIGEDITAQKMAEDALRKSDERLQVFFNQSLDGFFFCQFETPMQWKNAGNKEEILEDIINTQRFTDVNNAMLKQYDISREDFLKLTTKDVFAHDLEQGRKLRRELFDNERLHLETYERRTDGSPVWFEGDYVCLYDDKGCITGFFGIQRDITDRKESEIALREAEGKYRSIFENAVEGIYQSSPEGCFLTVNPAFARMLGFDSPEEMIVSITDIAHQIYGKTPRRKDFMQQIEEHGSVSGFEYQMRRKDNDMIWVSENARVVHNAEGKILYYEGVVEDITARKNAENSLMESEWRNRVVTEMTTDYTFIVDVDLHGMLNLRWASENMIRLAGKPASEVSAISIWKKIIHHDDASAFLDFVRQILESGKSNAIECRTSARLGAKRWVEINAQPLKDEHGAITTIVGAIKDVSERKRAEGQLRLQSAALNAAANTIVITDHDGNIDWVNPAYCSITGYSFEEVIGKNPHVSKSGLHDREFYKNMWETILRGQVWRGEMINKRKDGAIYTVDATITPILDANNQPTHFIGITQDVTERKQNEQHIDRQLKKLNALHAIDNAIKSSTDLRTTLDVLLKEVIVQLKADAACVLLFNKNTLTLDYTASRGFRSKATQQTKLGSGQGFAGRVILDRKTIHVSDLGETENKLTESLTFAGEKFTAYVGAPLIAKGQIMGVLEIFQRAPLAPDTDWFDFLDMLAGQTAIAIDSAQMFENLQRSNFELTLAYDATIEGWSRALDLRDKETEGHTQRVTSLAVQLALKMGISDSEILHIRRGALLHDIGKMGIPDRILHKPSTLTDDEREIMRHHTTYANEMLSAIPYLRSALDIPRYHHEKWDGTGYPHGLKGNEIPLSARIFAVVDVWDAVTSDRPYRAAWSKEKAIEYVKTESGNHFDPKVAETFLALISQA